MTGPVIVFLLGGVLLALLLLALLRWSPRERPAPPEPGGMAQVVSLPALNFRWPHRLFDPADYYALARGTPPSQVAPAVREERRRLAMLWLRLMREDMRTLWRFRRLLAAHGVSGGPGEELRIALAGLAAWIALTVVRIAVMLVGPFGLVQFVHAVRARMETIREASAALFGQLPSGRAADLQRQWLASLPSAPPVFTR